MPEWLESRRREQMGMYEASSRQQRAEEPELTAAIEKAWAGVV